MKQRSYRNVCIILVNFIKLEEKNCDLHMNMINDFNVAAVSLMDFFGATLHWTSHQYTHTFDVSISMSTSLVSLC